LVALGLAIESGEGDPLLRYLGCIEGPADLSATVDKRPRKDASVAVSVFRLVDESPPYPGTVA
jgi:hypothetical protein